VIKHHAFVPLSTFQMAEVTSLPSNTALPLHGLENSKIKNQKMQNDEERQLQSSAVDFLSQCAISIFASERLRISQLANWKAILQKHWSKTPLIAIFGGAFLNVRYLNSVYQKMEEKSKTPLHFKLMEIFPDSKITDSDVEMMSKQSYYPHLEKELGEAYQTYLLKNDNFEHVMTFLDQYNGKAGCGLSQGLCRTTECQSCKNLENLYKFLRLNLERNVENCLKELCVCLSLPFLLFSFSPEKHSSQGFH
jgi:hypothetical protein